MGQGFTRDSLIMLREMVRKIDEFGPATPTVADLKRLLTERIEKLEGARKLAQRRSIRAGQTG